MSGLSQRTHGELNNIAANIVLSEKLGGRIKSYVSGSLSPIIKKNLKLDPKKGLAKGLLDKGLQKVTSGATKFAAGALDTAKKTALGMGSQAKAIADFTLPYVALPLAGAGVVADLTAPIRGGESRIRKMLPKPSHSHLPEQSLLDGQILTEEVIEESTISLINIIESHLIEYKLADDSETARKIMENMSDEWVEKIILSQFGG